MSRHSNPTLQFLLLALPKVRLWHGELWIHFSTEDKAYRLLTGKKWVGNKRRQRMEGETFRFPTPDGPWSWRVKGAGSFVSFKPRG